MKTRTAAVMIMFGFLLAFGAVGGMENPALADYLPEQLLTALVGLGLMYCGTLGVRNGDYYDER